MASVNAPAMTSAEIPCIPFFMRNLLMLTSSIEVNTTLSHKQTAFPLQPVEQELNGQGGEQQAHQACDDFFRQGASSTWLRMHPEPGCRSLPDRPGQRKPGGCLDGAMTPPPRPTG